MFLFILKFYLHFIYKQPNTLNRIRKSKGCCSQLESEVSLKVTSTVLVLIFMLLIIIDLAAQGRLPSLTTDNITHHTHIYIY